jgi:hypothetical protein
MRATPSLTAFDKALVAAAGLASKSAKLSPTEKRELKSLAVKGTKRGRQGFTMTDRARCVWLIRKAGPDNLKLPRRLRKLLRLPDGGEETASMPAPLRGAIPTVDPLDRLDKLGRLRGNVLSEAQFDVQRARILADPAIGTFRAEDGADALDRLRRVGELQSAGVITAEQAARLIEQILDAA